MPKFVFTSVFDAPDNDTAQAIGSDTDGYIGMFAEGSTPNGIAGVHMVGSGVVQVA